MILALAAKRQDLSGPAVAKTIQKYNFTVSSQQIVGDEQRAIEQKLIALSESARLVLTTGGTGIAARDVTPEATRAVCDRTCRGNSRNHARRGPEENTIFRT